MEILLSLISGLCWSIVYIETIRVGFRDKSYGMPFVALALNIAWEGLYSWLDFSNGDTGPQAWINLIWFLLDIVIVVTYFKYGRKEWPKQLNQKLFVPWTFLILILAFACQYMFHMEFGKSGPIYSAFLQNLIMSILFMVMLVNRNAGYGQSVTVAVCKWIGTLAPTILIGIIRDIPLVIVLGIFCTVFDVIYIFFLRAVKHKDYNQSTSNHLWSSHGM
jgi:hypothetical protein